MKASDRQKEEKGGFWQRYKFLIIGILGALLLLATLSTQNVILSYQLEDGTQYAVKLDYSTFGMCIRCYPGTKNANDVVEKAIFFGVGKKKSVLSAARALQEVAGVYDGSFRLQAGGILGNNGQTTNELVAYLTSQGFDAAAVSE